MNHLKLIHQYLKERGSLEGIPSSGLPFVTISRQVGAGGHLLAHVILTDFLKEADRELFGGWHVFDRELCEIVASDPELETSMEALMAEEHRSEFTEFIESLFSGRSKQYSIQKKTFRIVRMLASLGKVIIVGRAGACVTCDLPGGVHVRVVAPETTRLRWLAKKFRIDKAAARVMLKKQEADRHKLLRTYFNKDVDDPLLYDAIWNSESADMHEIAASVITMIKRRAAAAKRD